MAAGRRDVKKQRRSRRPSGPRKAGGGPETMTSGRRVVLQIDIRPELKRVLQARALNVGMTLQSYVLSILRDAGLPVRRDDLLDRRRHENRKGKSMPAKSRPTEQRSAKVSAAGKAQAPSPELLERLGLKEFDGLGPCVIVVNVDGGRLRKKVRKRVAESRPRRHLARRRKSK